MCFAPQRRTFFRHLKVKKGSEPVSFWHFWLGNVLRATTACTFSTSQLPKVVWEWCFLYILTWTRASRHNGVQFFISYLASWLRTRRFSEVAFRPSRATNHWKNTVNRDFTTFSRTCIFSLLTFSLFDLLHLLSPPPWLFPPLLFHVSILSEVWLQNFLRKLHFFMLYRAQRIFKQCQHTIWIWNNMNIFRAFSAELISTSFKVNSFNTFRKVFIIHWCFRLNARQLRGGDADSATTGTGWWVRGVPWGHSGDAVLGGDGW